VIEIGGYRFRDEALARQALTHRSAAARHSESNERLEWIGDAVLGAAVTLGLAHRFPRSSEAMLAPARAAAVRNEHLAGVAREIGIPKLLIAKPGLIARLDGSPQVLADAVEAVLGAIALDGGFAAAEKALDRWFSAYWEGLESEGRQGLAAHQEARARLKRRLRDLPGPARVSYQLAGGEAGDPFRATCTVRLPDPDGPYPWSTIDYATQGEGRSKRLACRDAAERMLESLPVLEESCSAAGR